MFEEEAIKGAAVLSVSPETVSVTQGEIKRFARQSWYKKKFKIKKKKSDKEKLTAMKIVQRNQTVSDDGSEKDTGICLEVKDTSFNSVLLLFFIFYFKIHLLFYYWDTLSQSSHT